MIIRDIFFPRILGSYYVFAQRIIGIDIGKTSIQATIVKAFKHSRTIEKSLQERILDEPELSYQERVTKTVAKIISTIGTYDAVRTSVPTGITIFKELSIPFIDHETIAQVFGYDVEPLLPFSLENAALDFIITKIYPEEKRSDILVAALRTDALQLYIQPFVEAGIPVEKISIDLFELYSLYASIPFYNEKKGVVAFVDAGFHATRLAIIVNGQLRHIRSLSRGLLSLAHESLEQQFFFEKPKIGLFIADIEMTIQQFNRDNQPGAIILTGHGADIPEFIKEVEASTYLSCEQFSIQKITSNKTVVFSQSYTFLQSFIVSLSTALALEKTQAINLDQKINQEQNTQLLNWQIITAFIFSFSLIALIAFDIWRIENRFTIEITRSSDDALTKLRNDFTKVKESRSIKSLTQANKIAYEECKKEELAISQILRQNNVSFLACLEELTQRIDKEALGLELTSLKLNENSKQITIDGSVKGYKELVMLEQSLRKSKMLQFASPKLQETTFEIKLLISDAYGKSS
jgi:hypothetical protein